MQSLNEYTRRLNLTMSKFSEGRGAVVEGGSSGRGAVVEGGSSGRGAVVEGGQ